jgi:diguanylate cyclase (GGDEF)-like protein
MVDNQVATFSVNMRLRITMLYFVSMFLGYFAELVRHVAAKRLRSFTESFKYASMHDSLTGLANQNYLAKFLDETYQNRNLNTTLGCLFVDVDYFKNVNDTYGHLFGNVVLMRIGELLSQQEGAFVCRWGGDEFVVCMTDVKEEKLMEMGEKIRASVSACTFKDYPKFHITVSVGAVVLPVDETFNFDHVLDLADYANRMAKSNGKDNVSLAKKIPH